MQTSRITSELAQKIDDQWGLTAHDWVIQKELCTLNQDRAIKLFVNELIAAKMFPAFRALSVWLAFDFCLSNPKRFPTCGNRFFDKLEALRTAVYQSNGQLILELIAECKTLTDALIPA